MNQLSLIELRKVEFALLKRFREFCEDNKICYYLSNGTLLGAIKYKGFIPWDDDIDILVPRRDYDRLIMAFKDSDRYKLFAYERNRNYLFPFAKLCYMSTRKDENNIDNGVELGVDIDIFPLDYWDDDVEIAKEEVKRINRNMFALGLTKLNKADSQNPVKRFIKRFVIKLCKIIGGQYFIEKILKESNKESKKENSYMGCKLWCIYGEREIIPSSVFSDIVDVEFEGEIFPAPIGYDIYLKSLYGDYEKDPPKEKQKTHHKFYAYKI